ncbi:MAG: hypothetical protein Q7K35_03070 [bacterium]|nr:hypothetical protein [bacterium]
MNTKNTKIGLLIVGTIACGLGGLFFTASFALDELQSWPKALWEARTTLFVGIGAGVSLALAKRQFRQRLYVVLLVGLFVSFVGYAWMLGGSPPSRFWNCFLGIVLCIITETILVAKLMTAVLQAPKAQTPRLPVTPVDPSLN